MDPRLTCLENLDLEISVAYIALSGAREVWTRHPSAENRQRIEAAKGEVGRLLERRPVAQG